jgi:hypothetical protein
MSAVDNPNPTRAKRAHKKVVYNEEELLSALEKDCDDTGADRHLGGDVSMVKPSSSKDADAGADNDAGDDSASEVSYDTDSGSESDGSSYVDDEDDEDAPRGSKRRKLTPEERAVIRAFCVNMNISPKDFGALRKGLWYVMSAICAGGTFVNVLQNAHALLQWETPVSVEHLNHIISFVSTLVGELSVPYEDVQAVFAPLAETNGGVFAKASRGDGLRFMFGIALMAQMVHALPEHLAKGPTQHLMMLRMLSNFGDWNAASVLTREYCDDSPMNSAEADAKKLAKDLNELEPRVRLAILFGQLAQFATIGRRERQARAENGAHGFDTSWHDQSRTKSAVDDAESTGTIRLSATLVSTDKAGNPIAEAIYTHCGDRPKFQPFKHCKDPEPKMPYSAVQAHKAEADRLHPWPVDEHGATYRTIPVANARNALMREKKREWLENARDELLRLQGTRVMPFRAEKRVPVPTLMQDGGAVLLREVRTLLDNKPANAHLAPKLKAFLREAFPNHGNSPWGMDTKGAWFYMRFKGKQVLLGKEKPRSRNPSPALYGAVEGEKLPKWVWLHCAHLAELDNLIPPWLAHEPGTWEFFIYINPVHSPGATRLMHQRIRNNEIEAYNYNKQRMVAQVRRQADDDAELDFKYSLNKGKAKRLKIDAEFRDELVETQDEWADDYEDRLKNPGNEHAAYVYDNHTKEWVNMTQKYMKPFVSKKECVLITYPAEKGVWPADSPMVANAGLLLSERRAARDARAAYKTKADAYFAAIAESRETVGAEVGGATYAAGAASFHEAAAGSSSSAAAAAP